LKRFVIAPECLASLYFFQKMEDSESIIIVGAETYSCHSGYGRTFRFKSDYDDPRPLDKLQRKRNTVSHSLKIFD
jgi:hypothetical protein